MGFKSVLYLRHLCKAGSFRCILSPVAISATSVLPHVNWEGTHRIRDQVSYAHIFSKEGANLGTANIIPYLLMYHANVVSPKWLELR